MRLSRRLAAADPLAHELPPPLRAPQLPAGVVEDVGYAGRHRPLLPRRWLAMGAAAVAAAALAVVIVNLAETGPLPGGRPAAPSTSAHDPVSEPPAGLDLAVLYRPAEKPVSPRVRELFESDARFEPTLSVDDARVLDESHGLYAVAPTRDGICFYANGAGSCTTTADFNAGGAFVFSSCFGGNPNAVEVSGIAPDGVYSHSVALLDGDTVVASQPVKPLVDNSYRLEAPGGADSLEVGDNRWGIDATTSGCTTP
jgi:hypothetical protein